MNGLTVCERDYSSVVSPRWTYAAMSIFIPSILVKAWARELFDVGGGVGFVIALLGAWRVKGWLVVGSAAVLGLITIAVAALGSGL